MGRIGRCKKCNVVLPWNYDWNVCARCRTTRTFKIGPDGLTDPERRLKEAEERTAANETYVVIHPATREPTDAYNEQLTVYLNKGSALDEAARLRRDFGDGYCVVPLSEIDRKTMRHTKGATDADA